MSTLDNILGITRSQIDDLRAESADHAREATKLAEQMAAPTDAYRAMEAEERDLAAKLEALRGEMRTAKAALDAMAAERDLHLGKADAAADVADHFEARTLPGLAEILDGADIPPREALAATGLMPREDDGPISATLYQDNGLPMVWDASVPPGGYVCAATDGDGICGRPVESEPCDRPHAHQYVAGIGDPRCLCGNLWPCGRDDDLTAPGVADSRAQIAPHLPPPVPHDPAGQPVATHGPTVTMPDTGLAPDPLPPAAPATEARHARPKGSRLTGPLKALISKPEQDGDEA